MNEKQHLDETEVKTAIQNWLGPNGVVEIAREEPTQPITGWIMHPCFATIDRATRENWLWNGLKEDGHPLPQWQGLRACFPNCEDQFHDLRAFSRMEMMQSFAENDESD